MKTSVGDGEGEVSIISWAGYIERGETDPAYDWVTEFEKETSCKVTNKVAATSDEMVTLMNQGGFDLVTASGDASNRLIAAGKVQPINIDLIPSWSTVDRSLEGCALAYSGWCPLRCALSMGAKCVDVQRGCFHSAADLVGCDLRRNDICPMVSLIRDVCRPMMARSIWLMPPSI